MPNIDIPTFRAPKRRKTTTAPKPARLSEHSSDSGSDRGNDQTVSFVKPRTQVKIKARSTGIQFSNANSRQSSSNGHDDEAMAVVPVTDVAKDGSSTHGLSNRFIGSGMGVRRDLVENDPNITAYIDAEMARRRQSQAPSQSQTDSSTTSHSPLQAQTNDNNEPNVSTPPPPPSTSTPTTQKPIPQPNQLGTHQHHLSEVDLSAHPLPQPPPPPQPRKKKPKIRLGRDGKPYRPRPRPGPNEDDIARATLVEQVLNEHGVALAHRGDDAGRGTQTDTGRGTDEAADERMEREFRVQFLERQVMTSGAAGGGRGGEGKKEGSGSGSGAGGSASAGGGAGAGVLPSGPRLGGSRSARARMVAALEREREKEKEKEKEREK